MAINVKVQYVENVFYKGKHKAWGDVEEIDINDAIYLEKIRRLNIIRKDENDEVDNSEKNIRKNKRKVS